MTSTWTASDRHGSRTANQAVSAQPPAGLYVVGIYLNRISAVSGRSGMGHTRKFGIGELPFESSPDYKPVARRSASLIRSCQPGPSSRKCAIRSLSSLIDTNSLETGTPPFLCARTGSANGGDAGLNTASATDKASVGRYRFGGLVMRILPLASAQ